MRKTRVLKGLRSLINIDAILSGLHSNTENIFNVFSFCTMAQQKVKAVILRQNKNRDDRVNNFMMSLN